MHILRRADRAPDLVYLYRERVVHRDHCGLLRRKHAEFLWKGAKNAPDAPASWFGINPDKSLATAVITRIAAKAKKAYGSNTALLIEIPPGVTSAERLEELLSTQILPDTNFIGIFVVGNFPLTTSSAGGYRVLALKPFLHHAD
jgi:hypothetical protein